MAIRKDIGSGRQSRCNSHHPTMNTTMNTTPPPYHCPFPGCPHSSIGNNHPFTTKVLLLNNLNNVIHKQTHHLTDLSACQSSSIFHCCCLTAHPPQKHSSHPYAASAYHTTKQRTPHPLPIHCAQTPQPTRTLTNTHTYLHTSNLTLLLRHYTHNPPKTSQTTGYMACHSSVQCTTTMNLQTSGQHGATF